MTGTLEGVSWPPMFAAHAPLAALVEHLETTQWLPAEEIRALQGKQLSALIAFHALHSETLRGQLGDAGIAPADFADIGTLSRLPIQSRAALHQLASAPPVTAIPAPHLPIGSTQSSGSTGIPVTVRKTQVNALMWSALTVRLHRWSEPDGFGRLAVIRADTPDVTQADQWPPPMSLLHTTGPVCFVPLDAGIAEQTEMLAAFKPDSLLAYPHSVGALIRTEAGRAALSTVRRVKTFSETVSDELRATIKEATGAALFDSYSTQEVGYIAHQCPTGSGYHVMAEGLIVEIVNAQGLPCPPGETGRVLVTDLLNLATPVIRYDIGDIAVQGGPCACGRGLPTLARIMGRTRGMRVSRDGEREWPVALFRQFGAIAPIVQFQMIQHDYEHFELRVATPLPLSADQGEKLAALVETAMGDCAICTISSFIDQLPTGPNGKIEDFISLIGA